MKNHQKLFVFALYNRSSCKLSAGIGSSSNEIRHNIWGRTGKGLTIKFSPQGRGYINLKGLLLYFYPWQISSPLVEVTYYNLNILRQKFLIAFKSPTPFTTLICPLRYPPPHVLPPSVPSPYCLISKILLQSNS